MTDTADELALLRLQAVYGHVLDDRNWDALDTVFTDDAVLDFEAFGLGCMNGLAEIRRELPAMRHPRGHHVTNIVVDLDGDAAVMRATLLVVLDDGTAASGSYRDLAVRTPGGWRISRRKGEPFPRRTSHGVS
jgi:hypothetical protein